MIRTVLVNTLVLLVAAQTASSAIRQGAHAEYVGGTRSDIGNSAAGSLQAIDEQYLVFYGKSMSLRIPYERINLLEYGQKVGRRYAMAILISPMFVLTKTRQHFLTVGYTDEAGHEQALIFKVDKGGIRAMLVSLEARTGRKVEFQDEEARKAGKG